MRYSILLATVLPACGPSSTVAADVAGEEGRAPECSQYPVAATDGAGDEATARQSLLALDVSAELAWDDDRGTPAYVMARVALPGCTGSEHVQDHVLPFLNAHPEIFGIDSSEWSPTGQALRCDSVSGNNDEVSWGRVLFGSHLAQWVGYLTVRVRRVDASVEIVHVAGDYTPRTTSAMLANLDGCARISTTGDDVLANAMQMDFVYLVNTTEVICNLSNERTYRPNSADVVVLRDDPPYLQGLWTRQFGAVELRYVRKAWLIIAPSNHTEELLSSTTDCGEELGFELTIDAVTGEILSYQPGLGCVVC